MTRYRLGPALSATICTPDLEASIAAWQGSLHQSPVERGAVTDTRAKALGAPGLAGCRTAWLANPLGEAWLELIEAPGITPVDPFRHLGWLSLEISVADVDDLRTRIDEARFKVLGEPANLDVSDDIRAMQVIGPAGEVLYLTQVKAPVPPFELPFARCEVDRLFIPVQLTGNRERAVSVYAELNGTEALCFDTRVTVINAARDFERGRRHPVATLQLAGDSLIEIDQLEGLQPRDESAGLPAGIAAIAFAVDALPPDTPRHRAERGPHAGRDAVLLRGASGELIELIERESAD